MRVVHSEHCLRGLLVVFLRLASCFDVADARDATDGRTLLQVLRTSGDVFSPKRVDACDVYPCGQPLFGSAMQYPTAASPYNTALYMPNRLSQVQVDRWAQSGTQPMMMTMQQEAAGSRFETDVSHLSSDVNNAKNAMAAFSVDLVNVENDLKAIAERGGTIPKPWDLNVHGPFGMGGRVGAAKAGLQWQSSARGLPVSLVAIQGKAAELDDNVTDSNEEDRPIEALPFTEYQYKSFAMGFLLSCVVLPCACWILSQCSLTDLLLFDMVT